MIPERKSSNNEQVLGWMKSFSIPTRVIPTNANNNTNNQGRTASSRSPFTNTNTNNTPSSRYPMSPSSPRVVENDGTWKFVRRKPNPNNNNAITTSSTSNTLNPPYIVSCFS